MDICSTYQCSLDKCTRKPVTKPSPTSKHATEITDVIAGFIARNLRPIVVIEGDVLEPAYRVSSQKTKKNQMEKWDQLKATLLCALCGAEFVTITTEFWTYIATDVYVGITAHYITDN